MSGLAFVWRYVIDVLWGWWGIVSAVLTGVSVVDAVRRKPIFLSGRHKAVVAVVVLLLAQFCAYKELSDKTAGTVTPRLDWVVRPLSEEGELHQYQVTVRTNVMLLSPILTFTFDGPIEEFQFLGRPDWVQRPDPNQQWVSNRVIKQTVLAPFRPDSPLAFHFYATKPTTVRSVTQQEP